jgi:hypothetical protein
MTGYCGLIFLVDVEIHILVETQREIEKGALLHRGVHNAV